MVHRSSGQDLLIVGSGSQARYVMDTVTEETAYAIVGLVDIEDPRNVGNDIDSIPVVCFIDDVTAHFDPEACSLVIAYGKNDRKRELAQTLSAWGYRFATIVSSRAYVSPRAEIGSGSIINAMASVMPNARIGHHVIVHSQAVIEHDDVVGDYANIAPGVSLAGNVRVGEGSYVYTGASIVPMVTVGKWSVVGAGATVIRDVGDYEVVVGVPAKPIKAVG